MLPAGKKSQMGRRPSRRATETERHMKGHIALKRNRYYLVFDLGIDPVTNKRRQRWQSGPDRKGYTSKRLAERALREALTSVDRGAYVDRTALTVAAYLTEWISTLRL